jgi:hypothetical protein
MGFNKDTQVPLKAGEDVTIGRYTLRNTSVKVSDDGRNRWSRRTRGVRRRKTIDTLYPANGSSGSTSRSRRPRWPSGDPWPRIYT